MCNFASLSDRNVTNHDNTSRVKKNTLAFFTSLFTVRLHYYMLEPELAGYVYMFPSVLMALWIVLCKALINRDGHSSVSTTGADAGFF